MKLSFIKWFLAATGFSGVGAGGASLALSTNISAKKNENYRITKNQLMNGVRFNLSSLTNYDNVLSASIKQDMLVALGKNYKGIDANHVDMHFFYGGSVDNPEIGFDSDNFQSILYFTVKFHSNNKQFQDSVLTFDYRPTLYPWMKNYNGYIDATIWRSKKPSDYKNIGDLLTDFNNYLNSNYVIKSFDSQWRQMGLIPDGLSNSDKQTRLAFSKDIINYANSLNLNVDFNNFDTKLFDKIPDYLKSNTFKNFDSSLKIGWSNYYKFTSSSFSDIDENVVLSQINDNYNNLKLSDFKNNIVKAYASEMLLRSNNKLLVDGDQIKIEFKKSYKDTVPSYDWDTKIKDIDTNYLWVELESDSCTNPFVQLVDDPGFHIYINK